MAESKAAVGGGSRQGPRPLRPPREAFKNTVIARFLPGIVVVMLSLYVAQHDHGPVCITSPRSSDAASHATTPGPTPRPTGTLATVGDASKEKPLNGTWWEKFKKTITTPGEADDSSAFQCTVGPPLGTMWDDFFGRSNWGLSLAMILGSVVAGSTPLGGGVVAFPVGVLLLKMTPGSGRDIAVLIQASGMNAATYLLVLRKSHLLDFTMISTFVMIGTPGVLVGLSANLDPFFTMVAFQLLVLQSAVVFFYLNVIAPGAPSCRRQLGCGNTKDRGPPASASASATASLPASSSSLSSSGQAPHQQDVADDESKSGVGAVMVEMVRSTRPPSEEDLDSIAKNNEVQVEVGSGGGGGSGGSGAAEAGAPQPVENRPKIFVLYALMVVAAFTGGFLTANVGSGADIMLFVYGHFVWNILMADNPRTDCELTASSVVAMALISLITALCRALTRSIEQRVYELWGATAFVVCFGAPLGSLLLTPKREAVLKMVFYVLAVAQFVGFTVIKTGAKTEDPRQAAALICFVVVFLVVFVVLLTHYLVASHRLRRKRSTARDSVRPAPS